MKLIVIYGPPAAGKLTVAKELSKLTGYKILHNHLTADLVSSLIDFDKGNFWKYVNKFRLDMMDMIIKEKINVIYTFCYVKKYSENIDKIVKLIEKHKGKVYFVHLYANKIELFKRVKEESRKKYGKLRSMKELRKSFRELDFFLPYEHKNNIVIDNSRLHPKRVAKMIVRHYKLKRGR